tara:strand:+ start:442 stop:1329 length:888 start_codon:yes stop_codon:yes gene_type:complete
MNKISEKMNFNLFGEKVEKNPLLRDKFIEPPFSVLDTKGANWQKRKRQWKTLGIRSEIGRDAKAYNMSDWLDTKAKKGQTNLSDTSIFDPALCEVLYHWFCEKNGSILDPFAGGSVRGIVAHYLNYKYTGIELRPEQVHSNRIQAKDILNPNNQPKWITGDSNKELDSLDNQYDFVFSCPPYADLEVYSDLEGDISNMPYNEFLTAYNSIIDKSCKLLKTGCYACFVVGEVRNKQGNYISFVPDTIKAFTNCGMKYYNEAILLTSIASAAMRASGNMKNKKLVKIHQNILIFKKI